MSRTRLCWSTKKTDDKFVGVVTEKTYHSTPINGSYVTGVVKATYKRATRAQAKNAAIKAIRFFKANPEF